MRRRPSLAAASRRAASRRADSRRGGVLLEFVLLLPILVFILFLIVDLSKLMRLDSHLQHSVMQAARAGAQTGAPGYEHSGTSRDAFNRAFATSPAGDDQTVTFSITSARGTCRRSAPNNYVGIRATVGTELITPGLTRFFEAVTGNDINPGRVTLAGEAVVLCEVYR